MTRDRWSPRVVAVALLLLSCWGKGISQGEWEITLFLQPFPPPYLSDWEGNPSIGSLTLTNNTGAPAEVAIFLTLGRTSGGILASGMSLPISVPPGVPTEISSDRFIDWSTVTYDGSIKDQSVRSGRLPEGDYQACVTVKDLAGASLAPARCASFTIVYPAPPSLFFPSDGDTITTQYPTFSWTPVQVPPEYQLRYVMRIAEVLSGQTAHQALVANVVQYENENLNLTTIQYPLDALALEDGKTYAWQVQGVDQNGYPPSSNDGRSEIWTFTFKSPTLALLDTPPITAGLALLIVSGDSARGSLNSLDPRSDGFVDSLKAVAATGRFVVALSGDASSDTIRIPINMYIDRNKKSYALMGQYNGTAVLFSGRYGMTNDPREKALAIKLPGGGGIFHGFVDPNFFILAPQAEFDLTADDLPAEVQSFYGSEKVGVKRGVNYYGKIDLARYPRLRSVAEMMGIASPSITLQSYLSRDSKAVINILKDGFLNGSTSEKTWDFAVAATVPATVNPLLRRWVSASEVELELGGKRETKQMYVPVSEGSKINHLVDSSETKFRLKLTKRITASFAALQDDGFLGSRLSDSVTFSSAFQFEGSRDDFSSALSGDSTEVDPTIEFGIDNVVSLPLLRGVFEFHDPKLEINLRTQAVKLSGEFDFGQYKKAGELAIELERNTPDSTAGTEGKKESVPPGGVPTPFKQAELLSTPQGADSQQTQASKKTFHFSPTVSLKFAKGMVIQAREVISAIFNLTVNIGENLGELRDVVITRSTALRSTTLFARTSFMNSNSTLLASRMASSGGKSGFVLGLQPDNWSLKSMYPDLALPGLDNLKLSGIGLLYSDQELKATSADFGEDAYEFYRQVYKRDDFQVNLKPGLSLVATVPAENLDPASPLLPLMDKLGITRGPMLIEGTLSTKVKDLRLLAKLPPMHPQGSPGWFKTGELALELTGGPSIGLVGSMTVEIEGDDVTFFVKTQSGKSGLILVGGMESDEGWQSPFGIRWLTLNKAVLLLGLTPSGSVQLGFAGDMVIGEKEIRSSALIALNAATGVPTNVMFDGESEAGFGISDLTGLQAKMAAAGSGGSAAAKIPLDKFPPLDITKAKLKFAPKDSPELGIERGMAIGGTVLLRSNPGGQPSTLGIALFDVGDNGIVAKGDLPPLAFGPVSLQEARLDLILTRQEQHFIVRGRSDMGFLTADVNVNLTKTNMEFDASGKIFNAFEADLHARGKIDFSKPEFAVRGKMKNDFSEAVTTLLESGLKDGVASKRNSAAGALTAAKKRLSQAEAAREAARKKWTDTPLFPRDRKTDSRKKWTAASRSAETERLNVAARTLDAKKWDALAAGLTLTGQATGANRTIRVKEAEFDADLLQLKKGAVQTMNMTLNIRGNEQKLSIPGWNFKDMKKSLNTATRQVVQYLFDTTK